MKIIVGAMDEELATLIADLNAEKVDSLIHEYYVSSLNLVVGITGIGLVNAAAGLSYLLTKYQGQQIEWIINIGTSGTSDVEAKQGDILLVDQAIYSLANATGFGYDYGQIPQMPKLYQANQDLVKMVQEKLTKFYVKAENELILKTNIAASDQFVNSLDQSAYFQDLMSIEVNTFDMESTAYFQTAYKFNQPIMAIKVVSDNFFNQDSSELQFDNFLPVAAKKISLLIQSLV